MLQKILRTSKTIFSYNILALFLLSSSVLGLVFEDGVNISNSVLNIEIDNYDNLLLEDYVIITSHDVVFDDHNMSFFKDDSSSDSDLLVKLFNLGDYSVMGNFNLFYYTYFIGSEQKHLFYDNTFSSYDSFVAVDSYRSLVVIIRNPATQDLNLRNLRR